MRILRDCDGTEFLASQVEDLEFELAESPDYEPEMGEVGMRMWNGRMPLLRDTYLIFDDGDFSGESEYAEFNGDVGVPLSCLRLLSEVELPEKPDIQGQKKLARDILKKVRIVDRHALVAGGAAADWMSDRQANDIDIFLSLPAHYNPEDMRDVLENVLDRSLHFATRSGSPYGAGGDAKIGEVLCFYEGMQEVQFIVLKSDPRRIIEDFPFSHTEVSWDGEEFHTGDNYDMVSQFGLVIQKADTVAQSYKDKCLKKFKELGLKLCSSPEEALDLSMEYMLKRKKEVS